MQFFNEFILSLFAYVKAIKSIQKFGLLKYVLLLVILISFFTFPIFLMSEMMLFFSSFIPFIEGERYTSIGASFLSSVSGFFLLIILIPVFTLVSEVVNEHQIGILNKFSLRQFVKDMIRGLKITLRNLVYQYLIIVIVLILLNLFSTNTLFLVSGKVIIFMVTSYFYGFSLLDYAMENHKMNYTQSVTFMYSHKGLAIGLGVVYYVIIKLNDIKIMQAIMGDLQIYWSSFSEAIIAFIGVVAANIVLNTLILKLK